MKTSGWIKWALIINDINGAFVALHLHDSKKTAMQDLSHHVRLGYQVTMMAYSVYKNRAN